MNSINSWFTPNSLGGKLTMVVGLNWGSEAKGAVIAGMMQSGEEFDIAVRVGSHNAGHTSYAEDGTKVVVQTIPTAVAMAPDKVRGVIGAGGSVNVEVLYRELVEIWERTGVAAELLIDGCAILATQEHADREKKAKMKEAIGSTCKGVGESRVDKIRRIPKAVVGHDAETFLELLGYHPAMARVSVSVMGYTADLLNKRLALGDNVMIEGTQGFWLSLSTSGYYPFCTSIECTPVALLSDTGINYLLAKEVEVVGVTRTYPIRVHGNSGEMGEELTWDEMSRRTNGYIEKPEITTVTKLPRRIAELDFDMLSRAIIQTGTTSLAVTFLDYLNPEIAGKKELPPSIVQYLLGMESIAGTPVKYVGTGPETHWKINLSEENEEAMPWT